MKVVITARRVSGEERNRSKAAWRTAGRITEHSVSTRRTAQEDDTYLRWARRDFAEVKLNFAEPAGLSASVRGTQLRHELIDAAIGAGGSFQIACTPDAVRCGSRLRTPTPEGRRATSAAGGRGRRG